MSVPGEMDVPQATLENPPLAPTQPNQLNQEPIQNPARIRRTHKQNLIEFFKSMSLTNILKKNMAIEKANEERCAKTLQHLEDPERFPDPGSETASLLTISPEDMNSLKIPTLFNSLKEYMYPSLAKNLADQELEKVKRKAEEKLDTEEERKKKHRVVDGKNLVDRRPGIPSKPKFAEILFTTENVEQVPLTYFQTKHLKIISLEAQVIPQVRVNNIDGTSKGPNIIDKKKGLEQFGQELSMTCSQWCNASEYNTVFHQEQDINGANGEHAMNYFLHFGFFTDQPDREELYEAWAPLELRLRQELYYSNEKVDLNRYEQEYSICVANWRLEQKLKSVMQASRPFGGQTQFGRESRDSFRNGGNNWNSNKQTQPQFPRSNRSSGSQSFPSGSGRLPSTSTCLICAEKGHSSAEHLDERNQSKFNDGKQTWSKFTSRGLVTPDNKAHCINWNLRGDRAHQCNHSTDGRVHRCTFCGDKGHYALSWTCRGSHSRA